MIYYTNDLCKLVEVKGISILCNTENTTVIGLDKAGLSFWQQICNQQDIELPRSSANEQELFETLLDFKCISETPFDLSRHNDMSLVSSYLHVTNNCNLNCLGCYSLDDQRNKQRDPNLAQLKRAVSQLTSNGITNIIISGGEPFLLKDLEELLRYAKIDCQLPSLTVITNGTMKIDYSKFKGILDEITVSVDGYSEDHPTFIRNEGIFPSVMNAIKEIKNAGIPVSILPTLHSANYNAVNNYVELASSLGAPLNFSILSACENSVLKDYLLKDNELQHLAETILTSEVPLPVHDAMLKFELQSGLSCGAGLSVISVSASGDVYPCHMLQSEEFVMGNIFHDDLKKFYLTSPVAKSFRTLTVDDIESCNSCEFKYFCSGGCRARSYFQTGSINKKDRYCEISRRFYDLGTDELISGLKEVSI